MSSRDRSSDSFYNSNLFKIGLFALGAITVYFFNNKPNINLSLNPSTVKPKIETVSLNPACNETDSIQRAKESVVRVIGDSGEGSGFLIRSEGYILTNSHVIQDSPTPRIVLPDKTTLIGKRYNWDDQIDLAVIKVDTDKLKSLTFGDSDKLNPGQPLIVVGFPLGQELAGESTVSKGTYSAKRQSDVQGLEYIQIDASLNPGNSGSPVINNCGEIVGVYSQTLKGTEGLKFAISSKTAQSMVDSLISTGPKTESNTSTVTPSKSNPLNKVALYYNYISTRQIDLAYGLFSTKFKREAGGLNNFMNGFNATLNVYLLDLSDDDPTINSVYVKLGSVDLVGEKVLFRIFEGTWILIQEDGEWRLDTANILEIKE